MKNSKIKNYLEKLQNLPENKKKIILWTIVVILAVIMGFFWIRGAMDSLSKIGEGVQNIKIPEINTSDMPTIPSLDVLSRPSGIPPEAGQTTAPSNK